MKNGQVNIYIIFVCDSIFSGLNSKQGEMAAAPPHDHDYVCRSQGPSQPSLEELDKLHVTIEALKKSNLGLEVLY